MWGVLYRVSILGRLASRGLFPNISSERLRVYRDRSPALVLWKSRLGDVYWDRFSSVLRGGGAPFEVRTNLLLENWLLSSFLSARVGSTIQSIDFGLVGMGVGRPFEVRANLLLKNWLLNSFLSSRVGGYCREYRF